MRYFFIDKLRSDDPKFYFVDKRPKGLGVGSWRMAEGAKIADKWPKEPPPVYPSDDCLATKLPSLIGNTLSYLIVSSDLRKLIQEQCREPEIEYLPITLYTRKKREQSRDYWLVNPIGTVDCLDLARSEIVYNKAGTGEVVAVHKFVLDSRKLTDVAPLFRIKEDPRQYVVTEPLARAFAERPFTNLFIREIDVTPPDGAR